MAAQMQSGVFIGIVGFLKHGNIVHAAGVEVGVFIGIDRINFNTHHPEIFPGQLAGLADILHRGSGAAFTGENQNFLQTGVRDGFQLFFDLFHGQLGTANLVVAVKAAVDAVILAVVGNIQRGEHHHRIAEVLAGFLLSPVCHFLQKGVGGRRQQRGEIIRGEHVFLQRPAHISGGIAVKVTFIHFGNDRVLNFGADLLHSGLVLHMIGILVDHEGISFFRYNMVCFH